MSHPFLSTLRPDRTIVEAGRVCRPDAWAARLDVGPDIAVLITACPDVRAAVRGYGTMLSGARVILYGHDLSAADVAAAKAAGASVRPVRASGRAELVRRMLAETDADIYILAHAAGPGDVCVAPCLVAEIDRGEKDLVDVVRCGDGATPDAGDRLLSGVVDFLFGRGGDALASDFKACSRRFASSYCAVPVVRARDDLASALDLTLHALRLRLPIGRVAALSAPGGARSPVPARDTAGWVRLLALVARLLVEERPRRVLGLMGLAAMALGVGSAVPWLQIHQGRATLPLGPAPLASIGLVAAGGALGVAGLLLDTLTAARQEVGRLACLAIPRRRDAGGA